MATRDEVVAAVATEGSQAAAARKLGISRQRVGQILNGDQDRLNAAKRARYKRNREAGLCCCGRPPVDGGKACERCRALARTSPPPG